MKNIFKLIVRIIMGMSFIYTFNIIMSSTKMFIPINLISTSVVTCLGFPGLLLLVFLNLI